jgi:hypothetical protein
MTIDHRHEDADSELTNRCTAGAAEIWDAPGTLGLIPPRIPLVLCRLDAGMQAAGVDGYLLPLDPLIALSGRG